MKMNVTLKYTTNYFGQEIDVAFVKGRKKVNTELFDFRVDESEMLFQGYYWNRIKNVVKRLTEAYDANFTIEYINIEDEFHRHYLFSVSPAIDGCNTAYVAVRQDEDMHDTHLYVALLNTTGLVGGVHFYSTADFKNLGNI